MNRFLILAIVLVVVGVILSIPLLSNQFANAGVIKKIQFTQTITSAPDPGQGHSNEQMAIVLVPNNGTLYHGTLTYAASEPVQVAILHQIDKDDAKGQPTWTVDGNTLYAETIIDSNSNSGTLDFTGSAVGLHSTNSSKFIVTASVDGWIRGITPEAIQKTSQILTENYTLKLTKTTIPVQIPLHKAFSGGKSVYYIITDSSNNIEANQISDKQKWKVQQAPSLAHLPQTSLGKTYVFTNGITGNGIRGFQDEVFSNTPEDSQYNPLSQVVQVTWNIGKTAEILNSTQKILDANMTGKVKLTTTNTIMNTPQMVWSTGQMNIRDNQVLSDQASYVGGQILNIDTTNLVVTFVAHRGWGPDGQTVYYIITNGTPEGPAKMMGLINTPSLSTFTSVRDLFHFSNGIKSTGLFGYQEGITSAKPGDDYYTPLCQVSLITWKNSQNAVVLENMNDINSEKSSGGITIEPASVFSHNYILDCPIVEIKRNS